MRLTGTILARLGGRNPPSQEVRRTLVRTLYTQSTSMAIGSISGILAASFTAIASGEVLLICASLILTIIGIVRVASAFGMSSDNPETSTVTLELAYVIGAFSYALAVGMMAALTMLLNLDTMLQVLMVANATVYSVAICARNAARPAIAMGQMSLTLLPIFAATLYLGTPAHLLFSVCIALVVPGMASVTMNVFNVLRESISSAETSAKLADDMQVLARTDVVTGLANRAGLNHAMGEQLQGRPAEQKLALLWLDLDRFKEVNDLLGHPVGDRVLMEIAIRLRAASPAESTVCRFGGDEFIILAEVGNRRECETLAGRLFAEVLRPVMIDSDRLEVRSSMGIALLPDDGIDADLLMQRADLALYHAKVNGRNQICFYNPSMSRDLMRRREIEAELRGAIGRDELSIYFQPIVDLESGRIRTFEALVRWFHPEKGELKPDEFIPVAEETGLIVTLGNWITAQAAKACINWPDDVTVAVNLSPLQIRAPGAALGIMAALRDAGLPAARLELEVTESLFLDDNLATADFITNLTAEGVRFVLDDFGTGYSSLGHIHKYPFKTIKVDRSFVSGPNAGPKSDAIIRAVAELGANLKMDIVAEGLETVEQVNAAREAGCTGGQGYYFSRAVPDYMAALLLAQERETGLDTLDPNRGNQRKSANRA